MAADTWTDLHRLDLPTVFGPRLRIKSSILLRGTEKELSLEDFMVLKNGFEQLDPTSISDKLKLITESQLSEIHCHFGKRGLFSLWYLIMTTRTLEQFTHFYMLISNYLALRRCTKSVAVQLECDNASLPECADLHNFNWNVIQPSLSRKLYQPGARPGLFVYGLGNPRILVSHPFQGIAGEFYKGHINTINVVTSLVLRGYFGSFLFLDFLHGLDFEIKKTPAWLLWFSIIACHSDLVVFVKEYEKDFAMAQRREIQFTPDRTQKKIVEIPSEEITWARKPDISGIREIWYLDVEGNTMTGEEFYKLQAREAEPFIKNYAHTSFRKDKLVIIDEARNISEYPLDYVDYIYAN